MKVPAIVSTLFLLIPSVVFAQIGTGSWNIINMKYIANQQLSFFGEAQIRSLQFYNDFHYYEYKGGIEYNIHKQVKITAGAGSYQTFREGGNFVLPKNNDEFRLWPQIVLSQSIGHIKIEQRYRTEFRFTRSGYRNRFRYRFGVFYPFGASSKNYKPFQISASNELFFTDNEPYFERNRSQIALSYKPSKSSTIQLGYIYQFDYKINDEIGRDFIQIGYYFELFRKTKLPEIIDSELKDN